MSKQNSVRPEQADTENPEWTDEDFKQAVPASEMLASIFGAQVAQKCCMKALLRLNEPSECPQKW